ncbi:MAG: SMI1/KNR4 family protein [Planctomycetes bacterium]|nr:SMI1/KNR4 family protein [Planctomycetota bacterium]
MDWSDLDWEDCDCPLSEDRVAELEHEHGIAFPKDFRRCIRQCNGGYVAQSDFDFVGPSGRRITSCIGAMLRFDTDADVSRAIDVWDGMGAHRNRLVIPFAETGGGDLVCLDYRSNESQPKVVYYQHETGDFAEVARNFADFIDMLYAPADE